MTQPEPYRRVHRLTPLLQFWTVILALFAIFLANLNQFILERIAGAFQGEGGALMPLLKLVGAFIAVCVAIFVVSQVWWAAMGFRLDPEEVRLKRGVISKQLRTARYDRIQAVDVVEPLIARIFGLAAVRVETAGGASSAIEIAYLPRADAENVRAILLDRVRGHAVEPVVNPAEEPTYLIAPIPIGRSLIGTALRGTTIIGVVWVAFAAIGPLSLATALPLLVGLVPPIWNMIDRSWRFNARLDDDNVLHLAYGLASRRRQAVPLARIHAISIVQPMLWRPLGWWSVSVSVAGYGSESNKSTGTTRILPVGSREQAMDLVATVGPLARAELDRVAAPEGSTAPTYRSPKRARWVSPLDAHRQTVTLADNSVVVHSGLLVRRVALIEAPHIQELTARRGPIQHALRLSTIRLDLVPGPVSMSARDLDVVDARELVTALRQRKLPAMYAPAPPILDE